MSTKPKTIGMAPPHPGEFIRDEIFAELKLSLSQVAKILGIRRATLSDFVNCKAALSPEMALRIEKAFGVNMETLLRMQHGTTPRPCAAGRIRSTCAGTSRPQFTRANRTFHKGSFVTH